MIALDRQRVRAQRRHLLHHFWLLEGVLSGFNHGVRHKYGEMAGMVTQGYLLYCKFSPCGDTTLVLGVYKWVAPLVLKELMGVKVIRVGENRGVSRGDVGLGVWAGYKNKGVGPLLRFKGL
ncbi:hypothetical protein Tco_1091604 [Tanacetum coccineum]|uniref:Uncharacterized protein n=1 Tax=Tanacetum coccineum TaxID=301880 RepID=A0ABQ5I8N9_9ASTR